MHAAAHINLGTLYYNRQEYALAEKHYRSAIQIDPRYALAYFDLGNVLDETGRVEEAINTYKTAIQLAPTYADAHYNIALAYEKDASAPQSAATLARLCKARHDRPLDRPRQTSDPAHSAERFPEAGALPQGELANHPARAKKGAAYAAPRKIKRSVVRRLVHYQFVIDAKSARY
jgi:tetratricopeptide (TPR) repeat protein